MGKKETIKGWFSLILALLVLAAVAYWVTDGFTDLSALLCGGEGGYDPRWEPGPH